MKLKYIITSNGDFAIFSELSSHQDIARSMYGKPVSAGFCYIDSTTGTKSSPFITCFGESTSLNLESTDEDSNILTEKINS
jgi:hypothetical protein